MKNRVINLVLWLAYLLAMLASLTHVAATLNTLERPGWYQAIGWIGAISIDAGLAALAYAIQQRRRAKRGVRGLWVGIILFASISAYANVLHALSIAPLALAEALVFSGALPLLVIYMGEIVSSDDAAAIDATEREQRRMERKAERMDATQVQITLPDVQNLPAPAPQKTYQCCACGASFDKGQQLSAHMRWQHPAHAEVES